MLPKSATNWSMRKEPYFENKLQLMYSIIQKLIFFVLNKGKLYIEMFKVQDTSYRYSCKELESILEHY